MQEVKCFNCGKVIPKESICGERYYCDCGASNTITNDGLRVVDGHIIAENTEEKEVCK